VSDIEDDLEGLRAKYAKRLDIFKQYAEAHNVLNIKRREDFILLCLRDIEIQHNALKRKNNKGVIDFEYLDKLDRLKNFFADVVLSMAADLKCLDYVDFCISDENRQQIIYEKNIINKIEQNNIITNLDQPVPCITSKMNTLPNYVKDNVIILSNCNKIFDEFKKDDELNVYWAHMNLMQTLIYNIDSYVFNKIINYCNQKEPDAAWNRSLPPMMEGLPPISIKEHYLELSVVITEVDMKIYEETVKYVSNYILTDTKDSIILQMLDDFEPNRSSSLGCALNAGKYRNKDVCVLAQMKENQIILGSHYSTKNCCNSDVVFQFEHIFRLPDIDDLDKPLYMDATVEVLTNNLKVIKIIE